MRVCDVDKRVPQKTGAGKILQFAIISLITGTLAACGGGGGGDNNAGNAGGGAAQPVNNAPTVANPNLDQAAEVGVPFNYDAAQNGQTFNDADNDTLTYSVALAPGNSGLTANGAVISGTPNAALTVTATITAQDPSGAQAQDQFDIVIQVNQDVLARSGPTGLRFFIGQGVNFDASSWAAFFEDPSGNGLTFQVNLNSNIPGLTANGATLTGTPTAAGVFSGQIVASNGAGADSVKDIRIAVLRATTTGAPNLGNFDYVAYSETDVPLHYSQGGNNGIAAADNTPNNNQLTNAGARLGRALFYDTRLSVNNTISCASCHVQAFGFGEPSQFSRGFNGQQTDMNAPSLSNVRFYHRGNMFWDERAATLEDQALGPIQSPVEMGNTLPNMVATVQAQAFYPPLFQDAFGDNTVTAQRIAMAIAQFQRAMVSYQSRFDTAVIGANPNANTPDFAGLLTQQELHGMALFQPVDDDILAAGGLAPIQSMGCNQCHQGNAQILSRAPNGNVGPQNIGLDTTVAGGGATGNDDFKVPSLRNIEFSSPYMHDGRFDTLEEVVNFYAQDVNDNGQTSRFLRQGNNNGAPIQRFNLDDEDVAALVAFMRALSDETLIEEEAFSDPFTQ